MTRELLRVRDLAVRFFTEDGQVNAVDGISFTIKAGEVFGLVGESGAGKSVTARALMDLIETPGRITDGAIWYDTIWSASWQLRFGRNPKESSVKSVS